MSLLIRKPGIHTTVQDTGRTRARSFGVNPNGPMDTAAQRLVNIIIGNDESEGVLEMHFPAPEIEFDADAMIAIGGADFGANVDDVSISNWSNAFVPQGSVVTFEKKISGNRAYLAVRGGFRIDKWLGSASTNLIAGVGGVSGRKLMPGDRIVCGASTRGSDQNTIGASILPRYSRFPTVRVLAASEYEFLTPVAARMFLGEGFTLTNHCDRMGYRMTGKPLHLLDDLQMVSSAVTFGTIQLLPDGQIIILMADHQTSGGYPRIANVISVDLPILGQCGPGDGVSFTMVSIEDAERLVLEFENKLNFLRVGCRLQNHNAVD
ncbi:MAG: biotin-dependent carboxyltransferase family protein [Acidobacteriota bacterium]